MSRRAATVASFLILYGMQVAFGRSEIRAPEEFRGKLHIDSMRISEAVMAGIREGQPALAASEIAIKASLPELGVKDIPAHLEARGIALDVMRASSSLAECTVACLPPPQLPEQVQQSGIGIVTKLPLAPESYAIAPEQRLVNNFQMFAVAPTPTKLVLADTRPFMALDTLNRMIIDSILSEARSGRLNKRNPALRQQLVWIFDERPFTPECYQAYQLLLESAAGNTAKKRMLGLKSWANEADQGTHAGIFSYYTAYHAYRSMDYDLSFELIGDYEKKYADHLDRVLMLKALCLTQKNKTSEAVQALKTIELNWPKSAIASDAMFTRGWLLVQSGDEKQADLVFENLIATYPDSDSARKAKQILSSRAEQEDHS